MGLECVYKKTTGGMWREAGPPKTSVSVCEVETSTCSKRLKCKTKAPPLAVVSGADGA